VDPIQRAREELDEFVRRFEGLGLGVGGGAGGGGGELDDGEEYDFV
jgi:hypothetical protein